MPGGRAAPRGSEPKSEPLLFYDTVAKSPLAFTDSSLNFYARVTAGSFPVWALDSKL